MLVHKPVSWTIATAINPLTRGLQLNGSNWVENKGWEALNSSNQVEQQHLFPAAEWPRQQMKLSDHSVF